jgi:hypothetical protein
MANSPAKIAATTFSLENATKDDMLYDLYSRKRWESRRSEASLTSSASNSSALTQSGDTTASVPAEQTWYVRMGILRDPTPDNPKRYGARESVPITKAIRELNAYSLIIPSFTHRRDIPTKDADQQKLRWLWNTLEHPRYFGLLDLDMDADSIKHGHQLLFTDVEPQLQRFGKNEEVKAAFAARLARSTFGEMIAVCPAFATVYRAVRAFKKAVIVPSLTYYSGGGGFRILFETPLAWRQVTWGQAYAILFHERELLPLLQAVAPTLDADTLQCLLNATDKNIYDCDKGTKPDLLAHFETRLFPYRLHDGFEMARPSQDRMDPMLAQAIRTFWHRIVTNIPTQCTPLKADAVTVAAAATGPKKTNRSVLLAAARHYFQHDYPFDLVGRFFLLGERHVQVQSLHGHYQPQNPCVPREGGTLVRRLLLSDGSDPVVALHMRGARVKSLGPHVSFTERELAVDVDLDAYDTHGRTKGLRRGLLCTCVESGEKCCSGCWLLVEMSRVTLLALSQIYGGYGPLMVVYSGGKGAHFYFGSPTARALSVDARHALASMFKMWRTDTWDAKKGREWKSFYGPLLRGRIEPAWLVRGVGVRGLLKTAPQREAFIQHLLPLAEAAKFEEPVPFLSAVQWWQLVREKYPAEMDRFLLSIALPLIDLTAFTSNALRMPFSMSRSTNRFACPVPVRFFDVNLFDPATMALSVQDANLGRSALFKEAKETLEQWFNENAYPV